MSATPEHKDVYGLCRPHSPGVKPGEESEGLHDEGEDQPAALPGALPVPASVERECNGNEPGFSESPSRERC